MFRNIKSVILALLAVALMFGCQGPPRPGYNPGYVRPGYNPAADAANARAAEAEARAAKAEAAAAEK